MSLNRPWVWIVGGLSAALAVLMTLVMLYSEFATAVQADQPVIVRVLKGESLRGMAERLAQDGVLRTPRFLVALAVLRGQSARIKAGEYLVEGSISPRVLLDDLVSGRTRLVAVTIPEGFSLAEIARRVEQVGAGHAALFLTLTRDPAFIATLQTGLPNPPPTLEGLIFPETYHVQPGSSERGLILAAVAAFRERVGPLLKTKPSRGKLSPYEVLTLASIIEKETGAGSERPLISAVFHNRLKAHMRLASDPTVIYGISDFDGNLTRKHLRAKTPYNTYKVAGLTPTPIASPGLESIQAALAPAQVNYLYFVAKGDGTHFFSQDFETHQRAVWRYQIKPHRRRKS